MPTKNIIFDFQAKSNLKDWIIVNDNVMGGVSNSNIKLNSNGHGVFYGTVSLENNGGFASVHYEFPKIEVNTKSKIILIVKGDSTKYQLRIKDNKQKFYSYSTSFITNGDWQEIRINLKDMFPQFRGRTLNQPNFEHSSIEKIAILIGNKEAEQFSLEIDKIILE